MENKLQISTVKIPIYILSWLELCMCVCILSLWSLISFIQKFLTMQLHTPTTNKTMRFAKCENENFFEILNLRILNIKNPELRSSQKFGYYFISILGLISFR